MKEWWKVASMVGLITGCTVNADPAPSGDDLPEGCWFVLNGTGEIVCAPPPPNGGLAGSSSGGGAHTAGTAPVAAGGGGSGGTTSEAAGGAVDVGGSTAAGGGVIVGGTGPGPCDSGGVTSAGGTYPDGAGGVTVGGTGTYDPGGGTSVAGTYSGGGVAGGGGLSACSDFLVPEDPTLTSEQQYALEASICANVGGIVALVISTQNGDVLTCCGTPQDPLPAGGASGVGGATAGGATGLPLAGSAPR